MVNSEYWKILQQKKRLVKAICPAMTDISGIYMFYRKKGDEECVYIGQAKKLLERCASHLLGYKAKYPQYIDKSLYLHGLYSETNKDGWRLSILANCGIGMLDKLEQTYIEQFKERGYTLYNVTGGGQFDKKEDIGKRNTPNLKRYSTGKELGYLRATNEAREYFAKYLDYSIKGKTNKIKERKLKEFERWLNGDRETDDGKAEDVGQ